MSYCMQQRDQQFRMKPNSDADALAAIKASAKRKARTEAASHEDQCFAEKLSGLETLGHALEAWGWQLLDNGDGTVWLECLGQKLRDDRLLFEAIGPFVEAGSFIEMSGEDGTLWRWYFDGKQCVEQLGHVVFGESARVLITVKGGVADYVTDGNVNVALIDYDNEPDGEIPEGFNDLGTEVDD
jgi:hypothetical protein